MQLFSPTYFVFLAAVFLLYWPVSRVRLLTLSVILFANYFFYAKWDLAFLILIPAASTIDFLIGLGLQGSKRRGVRRLLVTASIFMNIGLLAYLKLFPLYQPNWPHVTAQTWLEWRWTLPISLSFYVFQALTYTIDLYRGDIKGTRSYLAHLSAVSFFPTTLAGPITRVSSLIEQFEKPKRLEAADGGRALFLIGMGLIKKLMIADFLASNLINRVFDTPNLYSGTEVLVAVYAYAFQIYFDFSGYTDIALGSAMLLGIRLPQNFNQPYAAVNIADFWRRWHISFSNWLRDYLYFSFPGKRTKVMPYVSLFLTMVIGGLWHGASWNFVIWGALHGLGLVIVRGWQTRTGTAPATGVWRYVSMFVTFHFVTFAWIFFRAPNLETVSEILHRIGSLSVSGANLSGALALILTIAVLGHSIPKKWYDYSLGLYVKAPFYAQAVLMALMVTGLQYVAQTGATPFIYNRF